MAVNLSPVGGVAAQFFDNAGNVLTGGKLYTYAAGTTTPQTTYTTSSGNIAWSNPIILDAAGRVPSGGEIWLTDGLSYKFVLKDSNDVLIATYDNVTGINSNFVNFTNEQEIQTATAGQTVFNLTTTTYSPGTNSLSVFVDGVNQYGPGAQYAYLETDSDTVTFVNGLHVGALVKFTTSQLNSSGAIDAQQVSYIPPFTGSVATNVEAKLAQYVSVKDFGAVGNGITDDTLAIQAAINYLSPLGGTLYFPRGAYIVSDANADNACLVITAPIQILGDGAFYTSIQPAAGVAGTVNTILVNPDTGYDQTLMSFSKISLGNLSNGTRAGNHGIYCLTLNASQNLPKFTVQECAIQQGGGFAIYHLNDPVDNVNGGMYACYINNNTLKGGIKFENSGDSLVVSNNTMTGTGTGVDAALITGASLLSILDNNITTTNSAIIIRSGMRVNILRNNIEHLAPGSNSNSVIDILSTGGTYVAGVIQQNLVSAFGATDATKLISINEARGTLIQDNTFLAGVAGITAINISSTCNDLRIGANTYNAAVATKVNDAGNGTMGVVKTPALLNSWIANASDQAPTYYKDLSGTVIINGVIKNGTTTFGTTLFQLPIGFRPTGTINYSQFAINGGLNVPAYIGVDNAGMVFFGQGGNTFLTTCVSFIANNNANSVSPE
jgi:hypothetical protein